MSPATPRAGAVPEEMLEALEALVVVESPSGDHDAVAASARAVAALGERALGAAPEALVVDGVTHLRWRLGSGPRRVLVLCHHDTVWPSGTLATTPWSVEDGVVRGPGCFDMKAGIVIATTALASLRGEGHDLDGVTLLVTGDEEVGSTTSADLLRAEAAGCAGVLVLEAAAPGGALKVARKGASMYEVSVGGRAAHAGLEPERGVNAGVELAHQVIALTTLADPALGTTVTPTVASAGTTGNTVPATARVHVDVRATTAAEQRRVDAAVRALAPRLDGAALSVEGGVNRPPMERAAAQDLFVLAQQVAEREGLGALEAVEVGGASDGNLTAGDGVPTLDGLGAVGGGAHAADEHVLVPCLPERAVLLAGLVRALCDGPAPGAAPDAPHGAARAAREDTMATVGERS